MSIFKLFAKALSLSLQNRRLALRLWAVHFLYALLAIAPLAFLIHGQVAHSLSAGDILARADIDWLTDLSTRYMNTTPLLVGLLLAAVVFYLLLTVFLNGGVIGNLLRTGARPTLAEFFHDCGLYFWRFLRLALLSLPFYLLFAGVLHGLVAALLRAFSRRAATEWPALIAGGLRLLALLLLLGIVAMLFDYVKIGLALSGRRSVLKETWRTLKWVVRRFFRAWGLYLLAGLAFVALTLLYLEVARLLPQGRPLLVLLVFAWQQLYVLGRQFSRILFFATEIELARQEIVGAQEKKREE
jgi:hypothetical protein